MKIRWRLPISRYTGSELSRVSPLAFDSYSGGYCLIIGPYWGHFRWYGYWRKMTLSKTICLIFTCIIYPQELNIRIIVFECITLNPLKMDIPYDWHPYKRDTFVCPEGCPPKEVLLYSKYRTWVIVCIYLIVIGYCCRRTKKRGWI